MNRKELFVFLVLAALAVTGIYWKVASKAPLTREQAIEISKNSELVKEGLGIAKSYTIESNYYNSSGLERLAKVHSDPIFANIPTDSFWWTKIPEGHTAWEIIWWFKYYKPGGYDVIVVIDAQTAKTVYETKGIELE